VLYLEIVFAFLWQAALLNSTVFFSSVAGAALIVLGSAAGGYFQAKDKAKGEEGDSLLPGPAGVQAGGIQGQGDMYSSFTDSLLRSDSSTSAKGGGLLQSSASYSGALLRSHSASGVPR
jgi:hypothetical protein